MAQVTTRRLGYALGAEVTGVDLRKQLDDQTIAEIRRTWLDNLVLCFPGQNLDENELLAFAKRFGDLEFVKRRLHPETPHISLNSNKPVNGMPWDGRKSGPNWHSDDSYTTRPTAASFLLCKETPEIGGDTMFANMYMAHESLSPTMQDLAAQLSAIHDAATRPRFTGTQVADQRSAEAVRREESAHVAINPPAVQPVVRIHPETRRKALFVGERVRRFVGMTEEESRPLLEMFNRHAVAYEFTYRHRWTVNDLIMWDNRCLLHVALCDYDLRNDIRHMLRCAVVGEQSGHTYSPDDDAAAATTPAKQMAAALQSTGTGGER
jgi:taurine dioxygenase